jgi:hypothetical protein
MSRHMTVYYISGKVHASIDWYILVHTGASLYIRFLLFCSWLHPVGPPESCGPASAKRHPFQATTSLFFHTFLWLLLAAAQPAIAGGEAGGEGVTAAAAAAARRRRRRRRRRQAVVANSMAT